MLKSVREFGGLWETSVILYLPQRKSSFDGYHYIATQGVFLEWEGIVLNKECVKRARLLVTRLVKGRLSDTIN